MANTSTSAAQEITSVVQADGAQAVRIPEEFRLRGDLVYIRRDPGTNVIEISERPFRPSAEDIFRAFDEAGSHDFEVERDTALPREIDL